MGLIKKPNELTVKNALSALIYGQPGMGKTTLALSSPQPLLLDFDGGVHRVNAAHRVDTVQISKCIIRKSKFPWFPERSVQFSGKRTKRSVQKKGCTQHL